MRTTKHAAILCLGAAAAVVPAAADDHTPRSLRMREPRSARPRWNAIPLGRRVAQVPPDGQPDDPPGDPSPPAVDPRSTPPDRSPPSPPSPPEPTLDGAHADQDGKTEVISVTGTTL